MRLHDVVSVDHKRHALQPLEPATVNARTFRSVDHVRLRGESILSSFSKKFNIKSALFVYQSPTLSQKIDSREGWFWCKEGVVANAGKMNIYVKQPPFTPVFGLFAAKYSAICR